MFLLGTLRESNTNTWTERSVYLRLKQDILVGNKEVLLAYMSGNIWLVGRVSQYFYTDLDYILGVDLVVYCTILLLDYNLVVE